VSKEYSLVLTDPRGAGCNDSENLTLADITSEKIADDIIYLIQNLKPKKYMIHGHSFGSVVATILSTKIAEKSVVQPSAIILEGVFGHYWDQRVNTVGLAEAWSKVSKEFSPTLRAKLISTEMNPFGLSNDQWIASIYQLTYLGVPAYLPYSSENILEYFVNSQSGHSLPEDLNRLAQSADYGSLPFGIKPWNAIACNELFYADMDGLSLTYSFGQLNSSVTKACSQTVPSPFNAQNWQMKHPTYYFIGQNDPATPSWQGLYHFYSQGNKKKKAFLIEKAGHRPLQLDLRDCMTQIYQAIFSETSMLTALPNCSTKYQTFQ
jgi:pimeloyl-ACP methyl ester carboxylesterase